MHQLLHSDWGRLFHNWEKLEIPADLLDVPGWADVGADPLDLKPETMKLIRKSLRLLGTCVKEAPEFAARKRHRDTA